MRWEDDGGEEMAINNNNNNNNDKRVDFIVGLQQVKNVRYSPLIFSFLRRHHVFCTNLLSALICADLLLNGSFIMNNQGTEILESIIDR